ncbi:MAG TPA: hypothetical protein VM658_14610 [bacterium]|nr:hypothetical protein [bacterium]
MGDCATCMEKHGAYAKWTCGQCEEPTAERTAPELWRALMWRKLIRAGYPLSQCGLSFWDLWLMAAIEEGMDERAKQSGP